MATLLKSLKSIAKSAAHELSVLVHNDEALPLLQRAILKKAELTACQVGIAVNTIKIVKEVVKEVVEASDLVALEKEYVKAEVELRDALAGRSDKDDVEPFSEEEKARWGAHSHTFLKSND